MNLHETADRGPKIHSETGRTGRAVHGHDPTSARRAVPTILTSRSAARELQTVDLCLRTLMSTRADGERASGRVSALKTGRVAARARARTERLEPESVSERASRWPRNSSAARSSGAPRERVSGIPRAAWSQLTAA